MTKNNKLIVSSITAVIAALTLWSAVLDFSRFIHLNLEYDIYPSAILKRTNVILAALVAWTSGSAAISLRDSRRIKAAFVFVCLGEAAFVTGEKTIGIAMFALCQISLIVRNSNGISLAFFSANPQQKKKFLLSSMIICIILVAFAAAADTMTYNNSINVVVRLYWLILCISLWTGITCLILNLLPLINSKLVFSGMICFFCCDILVGLDAVLQPGLLWLLANSFIWLFYIQHLYFSPLAVIGIMVPHKAYHF